MTDYQIKYIYGAERDEYGRVKAAPVGRAVSKEEAEEIILARKGFRPEQAEDIRRMKREVRERAEAKRRAEEEKGKAQASAEKKVGRGKRKGK